LQCKATFKFRHKLPLVSILSSSHHGVLQLRTRILHDAIYGYHH
jgi:hypothetical protein